MNISEEKKTISHALFLSGLLLPGLGQIYLGERKKGWLIMLLVLTSLIITFAKYMMGLLKIVSVQHPHLNPLVQMTQNLIAAYQTEKVWIWTGLLLVVFLWIISVADIAKRRGNSPARRLSGG